MAGQSGGEAGSVSSESLSRRCILLVRVLYGLLEETDQLELKLQMFDKLLATLIPVKDLKDQPTPQPNLPFICNALDLLSFLLGTLVFHFMPSYSSFYLFRKILLPFTIKEILRVLEIS